MTAKPNYAKQITHVVQITRSANYLNSCKRPLPQLESPQKPNMKPTCQSVNSQTLWTDNPSLKTKKKMSGPSRRGKFGTLPLSIGESENIEGNLLGSDNVNLGVRVEKIFLDEDTGKPRLFYGIVTAHDAKYDFYKVSYEDGDEEEVTPAELEEILASKTAVRHGGMKKMKRDIGQILRLRRSCFEYKDAIHCDILWGDVWNASCTVL